MNRDITLDGVTLKSLLTHPYSCGDTVDYNCIRGLTPEECRKRCKDDNNCILSNFIKFKKASSFCLPIAEKVREFEKNEYLLYSDFVVPLEVLENPDIKEAQLYLKNYDENKLTENMNIVLYNDHWLLQNVETSEFISTETIDTRIAFSDTATSVLQFYSALSQIVPVRFGDRVGINQISNSATLYCTSNMFQDIQWKIVNQYYPPDWSVFTIVNPDNPTDRGFLRYGSKFCLQSQIKSYLGINKYGYLVEFYKSIDKLKSNKVPFIFECIPQFNVYYCDRDQCKTVWYSDTLYRTIPNKFEGNLIRRTKYCTLHCKGNKFDVTLNVKFIKRTLSSIVVVLGIFLLILIIKK